MKNYRALSVLMNLMVLNCSVLPAAIFSAKHVGRDFAIQKYRPVHPVFFQNVLILIVVLLLINRFSNRSLTLSIFPNIADFWWNLLSMILISTHGARIPNVIRFFLILEIINSWHVPVATHDARSAMKMIIALHHASR